MGFFPHPPHFFKFSSNPIQASQSYPTRARAHTHTHTHTDSHTRTQLGYGCTDSHPPVHTHSEYTDTRLHLPVVWPAASLPHAETHMQNLFEHVRTASCVHVQADTTPQAQTSTRDTQSHTILHTTETAVAPAHGPTP